MIEFAIVLPLVLLLVGGVIDFGRIFFDLNHLTNAARDGARFGAVRPNVSAATLNIVRDSVVAKFNRNAFKTTTLTSARVLVDSIGASPDITVRVRIRGYQLSPVFLGPVLKDSITEVKAEFRWEYQ